MHSDSWQNIFSSNVTEFRLPTWNQVGEACGIIGVVEDGESHHARVAGVNVVKFQWSPHHPSLKRNRINFGNRSELRRIMKWTKNCLNYASSFQYPKRSHEFLRIVMQIATIRWRISFASGDNIMRHENYHLHMSELQLINDRKFITREKSCFLSTFFLFPVWIIVGLQDLTYHFRSTSGRIISSPENESSSHHNVKREIEERVIWLKLFG